MNTSVTIAHNFETAHRLPHLDGKCESLHGHSWWTHITVTGPNRDDGTVVEFGQIKHVVRGWIDEHLDHGVMLGHADPLVDALTNDGGTKLFLFDENPQTGGDAWPTVEAVARLLHTVVDGLLPPEVQVTRVRVTETHVNTAEVEGAR